MSEQSSPPATHARAHTHTRVCCHHGVPGGRGGVCSMNCRKQAQVVSTSGSILVNILCLYACMAELISRVWLS